VFNPDHLAELEEVSTTARLARSELAQKVQREAAKESEISMRKAPPWTKRLGVCKRLDLVNSPSYMTGVQAERCQWRVESSPCILHPFHTAAANISHVEVRPTTKP